MDGRSGRRLSPAASLLRAPYGANKINKRLNQNDWAFYKAGEDDVMVWEEGGVVVHCTVHDQTSAN